MSGIFNKSDTEVTSNASFDGYASLAKVNVGDQYEFVKFMTFKIFERIFTQCVNELSMTKSESDIIKPSSANNYTPYSEGFIYHLSKAAAGGRKANLYIQTLSNGKKIFTSTQNSAKDAEVLELDFSTLPETKVILKITAMMYEVINAATVGLKASKTILMKLEKLADQIADKPSKDSVNKQVKLFEDAVKNGKVAYVSSGSTAEFMKYDATTAATNLEFCYSLLSTITGYPSEFFNGVGGSSLSDTGASTGKAIRRATESYCLSVMQPFILEVFKYSLELKPNFDNIDGLMSALAFVESSEMVTTEDKKKILMSFGLSGDGVQENKTKEE